MGNDEQHTFALLNKNRQLQKPVIGELDIAFEYFDKAMDGHEGHMLWKKYFLLSIPELQHDPRTNELLDRIGVPY